MGKINYTALSDSFRRSNPYVEFKSGKWFVKEKDCKNIDAYLLRAIPTLTNLDELKKFKDVFITLHGEPDGDWYDLPIIEEAMLTPDYKPLCYPLNKKQMIIINYLLRHDEEVAFILTGVGGSGKSTFANIICQIFDNDTAALDLADLSNPFMLAEGIGKRLIYSTEINSDDMNNGILKRLFSNEVISVNPKNQKPYRQRCQSAFFFNCNNVPRLDLSDTGIMRRILYYNMNEKIKNPDPSLNKKAWTRADIVNIVKHAMDVDMTNWQDHFKEETRFNIVKDNSVYLLRNKDRYNEYVAGCHDKGLKAFSEPKWANIRNLLEEWGFIRPKYLPLRGDEPWL